jgi:ankyrin repeat protein
MTKPLALALTVALCLMAGMGHAVSGAAATDVYQALRANDLSRLSSLVTSRGDAGAADPMGETLLMSAAAAGSLDAMKFLVDQGADVNAQNAFGSTALVWSATDLAKVRYLVEHGANVNLPTKTGRTAAFVAAMSTPSAQIVRYLAEHGADLKAKDAYGNTLLTAAAVGDDVETVRLLLNAGIDPNAVGATHVTPLVYASYNGNAAIASLLLAKGANANAAADGPLMFPGMSPKSGPIALSAITPLIAAIGSGSEAVVKALLDAGAGVNAKDGRNMTALMIAVSTNHQNPAIIRMLVDRGADAGVQSNVGETAGDWAQKLAGPTGLEMLKVAHRPAPPSSRSETKNADPRAAAERAMALLETSSQKFFESSGCISCHHQNITDMAAAESRAHGVKVSADAIMARMKMLAEGPPPPLLMERMDIGVPEIFGATLTSLAALGVPPDAVTDKLVANIAASQAADGSWHAQNGAGDRPPAEEGYVTRTALCLRALKVYGPPGRAAELNERVSRARRFLEVATPVTADERNMKLLGMLWSGADAAALKPLVAAILSTQRPDGGWRQTDALPSDAYATGQSLFALAKSGVPATDPAYKRGVQFLLETQSEAGAWRVTSRSPKFQAYFNSGFPYAGDQWISAWATGWATMALAQAVAPSQ